MSALITALEATVRQAQSGAANLQSGLQPILTNLGTRIAEPAGAGGVAASIPRTGAGRAAATHAGVVEMTMFDGTPPVPDKAPQPSRSINSARRGSAGWMQRAAAAEIYPADAMAVGRAPAGHAAARGRGRCWWCAISSPDRGWSSGGCNGCCPTAACMWISTTSGRCRRRRR